MMETAAMFIHIANLDIHLDYPSSFKPHSWAGIYRTAPTSAVLWLGKFRAVISLVSKEA